MPIKGGEDKGKKTYGYTLKIHKIRASYREQRLEFVYEYGESTIRSYFSPIY